MQNDRRVYGGVAMDGGFVGAGVGDALGLLPPDPNYARGTLAGIGCLALADLPLSAAGDTLTLPITVWETLNRDPVEDRLTEGRSPARTGVPPSGGD
jgi:hypothetical protein